MSITVASTTLPADPRDYSFAVPRLVRKNLEFRAHILDRAAADVELQAAMRRACEWSCSFWVNCFAWTYNPRRVKTPKLPFISWPYQDDAFKALDECLVEQKDVIIEKSRDMGASWICLLKLVHCWLYWPDTTYLAMSRVSDLVDTPGDPDSLFWKVRFVLKHLPSWLMPACRSTEMHLGNLDANTTLDGYSTTGDAVVGGRRTGAFFDEFPKVKDAQDVWVQSADMSDCRIFNGTPNGTNNAFYRISQMDGIRKLRFHWSVHPEKAKGLYHDGAGKLRSPWYDAECKRRGNNKREIAAQLDIDYSGASFQYFDADEIERLIKATCEPYFVGDVDGNKFVQSPGGDMRLWTHLQGDRPPPGEYLIGADVAQGTGGPSATPSCVSIFNRTLGEKVGEFASPFVQPSALADYMAEVGRWFYNAKIIWEDIGPGTGFGARLVALGYPNLYYRRNEKRISHERQDIPGWYPTPENKDVMLEEYRRALTAGEFINRSEIALRECHQMIYDVTGHVTHSLSLNKDDPSGAKGNHADRVIADGLVWKLAKEFAPSDKAEPAADEPGVNSIAYRRAAREKREKQGTFWQTRRSF